RSSARLWDDAKMKILLQFYNLCLTSHDDQQRIEMLLGHGQTALFEIGKVARNGLLDAVDGRFARPTLTGAPRQARTLGDPVATLAANQQHLAQRVRSAHCRILRTLLEPGARRSHRDHGRLPASVTPG